MIDAAFALWEEQGLEGLTIRAVLARTGLARRAFYERFEGKDDLVLAVFTLVIGMTADFFAHEIAPLPDPMERLKSVVMAMALGTRSIESLDDDRNSRYGAAMSREHLRLADTRPDDLQAALRPLLSLIAGLLSDGMTVDVVRKADAWRLATLIYNLVSTTVHAELLAQEGIKADRARRIVLAEDVWEFCRRAIAV